MPPFFLSIPGVLATLGVVVLVLYGMSAAGKRAPRARIPVVLSLAVVATALYIVIARPEAADDHKWAYGIMGTVVGYWLRAI